MFEKSVCNGHWPVEHVKKNKIKQTPHSVEQRNYLCVPAVELNVCCCDMAVNNKRLSQLYSIKREYNIQCRYICICIHVFHSGQRLYVKTSTLLLLFLICLFTLQSVPVCVHEMTVCKHYMKINLEMYRSYMTVNYKLTYNITIRHFIEWYWTMECVDVCTVWKK